MEESWLKTYLRYTEKQESPELFHFWVGVSIISAVLGRKVWIDRGYYRLYPNFFTVLVAGSARCRKSTAIRIGTKLLDDLDSVKILSGKTTTERFIIDNMYEGPEGSLPPSTLVVSSELSVLLTRDPQGEKLIDVLTEMFDSDDRFEYRTISRGPITLRDFFITILAATTDSTLGKVLPDTAFGGGFASRIMFVYQEDTPRRNPFPTLSPAERELAHQLRERLYRIASISGPYTLTDDALMVYKEWYDNFEKPDDKRADGFFGRKHDHVLRLATILRASQGHEGKLIDAPHIRASISAVEGVEKLMIKAFGGVGGGEAAPFYERALRYIHNAGHAGIMHSNLLKRLYPMDAGKMRLMIATFEENGMIRRLPENMRFYVCRCDECVDGMVRNDV